MSAVLVAAISGIVYELLLGTTASFLLGDSVLEWSLTIGCFLAAMGLGSWLTRYVRGDLLPTLIAIEAGVAVVGGFSALALFAVFAWLPGAFRSLFYLTVGAIGIAVGLEIPLLTRALKRFGALRTVLSSVFAVDYGGALLASLLYPLLLYPVLGVARTALVASLFNLMGGGLILYAYRHRGAIWRPGLAALGVAALLIGAGLVTADRLTNIIDRRLYWPEELVYAQASPYQHLAVTEKRSGSVQLYLDGHLQFSSEDEARYHEPLVHVPMALARDPKRVLVLGGGDGLVARELLKYPTVESIVLVDLDPMVTGLARRHPLLTRVNGGALDDPRVQIVNVDAFTWLSERRDGGFDVAIADLPDPSTPALARLFSVQFYRLVRAALQPDGVVAVQAGSPYFARRAYWSIVASVEEAGFETLPYHVTVPSFGEWGFVAGSPAPLPPPGGLRVRVPTRFLDDAVLPTLFVWPRDMARVEVPPHTLLSPQLPDLFLEGWRSHAF